MGQTKIKRRIATQVEEPALPPGPEITPLQALIEQGAELLKQLRELEGHRRLTCTAFVSAAMAEANIDEARLTHCRKVIAEAGGEALSFVRRLSKEYSQPGWPAPARRAQAEKVVRIFGGGNAGMTALHELDIKNTEAMAVAALIATERFPGAFGTLDRPYDEWLADCQRVRAELAALYEQMRPTWRQEDIVLRPGTHADRMAGRCYPRFKSARDISPTQADWPEILVRRAAGDLRELSPEESHEGEGDASALGQSQIRAMDEAARRQPIE